mmetsp:Transcript_10133/g.41807  ORF Transcript_10133/g.41807 Transcript_10133/m.41807 type:complete len:254 (+) Transcript_10133:1081-1842(+)
MPGATGATTRSRGTWRSKARSGPRTSSPRRRTTTTSRNPGCSATTATAGTTRFACSSTGGATRAARLRSRARSASSRSSRRRSARPRPSARARSSPPPFCPRQSSRSSSRSAFARFWVANGRSGPSSSASPSTRYPTRRVSPFASCPPWKRSWKPSPISCACSRTRITPSRSRTDPRFSCSSRRLRAWTCASWASTSKSTAASARRPTPAACTSPTSTLSNTSGRPASRWPPARAARFAPTATTRFSSDTCST